MVERGTTPVIQIEASRKIRIEHHWPINRRRNVVERVFCRSKDWHLAATRFDREIKTVLATIGIPASVTWWF